PVARDRSVAAQSAKAPVQPADRDRDLARLQRWGRAITGAAGLTALAAGNDIATRVASAAAVVVARAVVWGMAERNGERAPLVRVVAVALADLVLVGLAVVGATHFKAPALAVLAAVPPVAIHSAQGGRDRGLFVGACALTMAVAAAVIAPSGHALNLVGAAGGAAVLAWIAIAVANVTVTQRAAENVVHDSEQALAEFRAEIVTTVSHEVRTPLTLIQGLTSTLAHRWPKLGEAEKLDLIDTIALNVASLDSSILHFVDAARIARGEFRFEPEVVDLAAALRSAERKLATAM